MTVTDHKWLDPNCDENGCQSLVLRESYQEIITALAMHSKQMTYAGNGKQFVDAVINNLDEVDAILPDSLNRPLVERIKVLLERANREAKLAVEFNERAERAERALRALTQCVIDEEMGACRICDVIEGHDEDCPVPGALALVKSSESTKV